MRYIKFIWDYYYDRNYQVHHQKNFQIEKRGRIRDKYRKSLLIMTELTLRTTCFYWTALIMKVNQNLGGCENNIPSLHHLERMLKRKQYPLLTPSLGADA